MRQFYCSFLLSLCFFSTRGQDTDSIRTGLLNQVNVIAFRALEENFQTSGSITVLTAKDLQNYQPRTVPEALTGSAGAFVQKTTHGAGSVFLRGLTGNQTLMLIDGIRLNNSTFRYGPNQYLNTVDLFSVAGIEVSRGAGSVAYGSDAMGGTIQLLTSRLQLSDSSAFHGKGLVRYATGNMEKSLRAEAQYTGSRFALHGGISIRNFGDLVGGDTTGRQSPSGYKDRSFDLKGIITLSRNWTLTLAHQSVSQHHVPVFYRYQLENYAVNEFDPQNRTLSYARVKGTTDSRLAKEITVTGSFQSSREGRLSRRAGSSTLRTETDRVHVSGFMVNVLSDITPYWTASSGIELYNDVVKSERKDETQGSAPVLSRGLYPNDSKYLNYALYSMHQLRLSDWHFSLGGRFNGFGIKVSDNDLGDVSISPSAFLGSAALSYRPGRSSNLYVSFNSAFRAPNIDDMGTLGIVDFRYELPAYDLKPETSYNLEAGYKLRTHRFALGTALYRNYLHNLITRVRVEGEQVNGIDVYRKENVEQAYIQGAEIDAEYFPAGFLKLYGSVSYSYGQNKTNDEPVRRIPPLNGRIGVELRKNAWYVRPESWFAARQDRLAAGDKSDNRIPAGGTPGWKVLNIAAGYDTRYILVNATVQNLFNEDYRTHGSGINGTGRSLWITLTGRF